MMYPSLDDKVHAELNAFSALTYRPRLMFRLEFVCVYERHNVPSKSVILLRSFL